MDANANRPENNLSEIERRLAGWHPATSGLNADAAMFAAGHAVGRHGPYRLLWPTLCGLLAVCAAGLGAWGLSERSELFALANRMPERNATPAKVADDFAEPFYTPSPGDYLSLRRQAEGDPNRWLDSAPSESPQEAGPPPPELPSLSAGRRDSMPDQ